MEITPGWEIGCYFVPIANLAMPYLVMKEIWNASASPADWRSLSGHPIVKWWWGLAYLAIGFIAAALAAYGALQASLGMFGPPDSAPLAIAVMVFTALLALMIREIEAIRDERTRSELDTLFHSKNSN